MSCSKLVSSLDKLHSSHELQCGENGHIELSWSRNIRERIVQFYFQLVRTNNMDELKNLDTLYTNLIIDILKEELTKEERREYLSILYKMIPYTRDIVNGKGEYTLSYMMIACWAKLQYVIKSTELNKIYENMKQNKKEHPTWSDINIIYMFSDEFNVRTNDLAYLALENFIVNIHDNQHPIGSFKDVKYFINYWRDLWTNANNTETIVLSENVFMDNQLIDKIIHFTNSQLISDIEQINNNKPTVSLVSKWIPREKSKKFGWMTKYFSRQYFNDQPWFSTAITLNQQILAEKKALTSYRKLLSNVNRYIDTPQIKQCQGEWSHINFEKHVTSITLSKQKSAFMNVMKSGKVKYPDNMDRIQCSSNFKKYIDKCKNGESKIKGKRVSIYDFVKDAISIGNESLISSSDNETIQTTIDTINLQWKDNSGINSSFNNLIAMVDTSGSMSCDNNTPLYNAIGLGIRIAERSTLGKRVLTFSEQSEWVNLDNCHDFISCVKKASVCTACSTREKAVRHSHTVGRYAGSQR